MLRRTSAAIGSTFIFVMAALVSGCGNSAQDSCENVNRICADTAGYEARNCAEVQAMYDMQNDAEKARIDTLRACSDDASTCEAVLACAS